MADRVTQAGHEWAPDEMGSADYFALVRREARRGRSPWWRLARRLRVVRSERHG